jgi:NAD(P)H-dependent FMN reductase
MSDNVRILAISGSLRRHSYNRRILGVAARAAERAGAAVTLVELGDYPLPLYNPDEHTAAAYDPNALRLQRLMTEHDGFLVASPEYNGSLPAVLKNAIDWCSRPSGVYEPRGVFSGKAAAIMSAGPGAFGGLRSLSHLRAVLTSVGVHVLPTEIAVPRAGDVFDGETDRILDAATAQRLEDQARGLVRLLERLAGPERRTASA